MKSFIYLLLAAFIWSCSTATEVRLTAGGSRAAINPEMGAFIAGADRNRTFTEIRDSLYAQAVVIGDGSTTIAIVTIDCIGLLNPEIRRIQQLASAATGIPADHIIVSSTHTHAGPDVVGIWGPDPLTSGVDTTYISRLVNTASEQIIQAHQKQKPVHVTGAEGVYGGQWFANICKEELDPALSVLQFRDEDGRSVATLTNFACHPTFLDTHFSVVSSDYPAAFYRRMDEANGGVNLFLQGAIGGWVQPKDEVIHAEQPSENKEPLNFVLADRYGKDVADSALVLLQKAAALPNPSIRFASSDFKLPVDNANWRLLSQAGVIHRSISDSVATTMAWFAIGPAQFATHPGETTPWLSLQTRARMGTGPRFVLGLSQDALGYMLKPEFFTDSTRLHAGYLTSMSLGPETTPVLLKQLDALIPN